MKFTLGDRYRLELYWEKVSYLQEGEAILNGCYFGGPVIKEVAVLKDEDYMDLDFFNQYRIFVSSYYIARLTWYGVDFVENKILLHKATLTNKYINAVPKLKNDDFIMIDTTNHVEEKHHLYLTYPAYLIQHDGELYKF